MNRVVQYRRYAGEALANARGAPDAEIERAWNEVADEWNALATRRIAWLKSSGREESLKPTVSRRDVKWRDLRNAPAPRIPR